MKVEIAVGFTDVRVCAIFVTKDEALSLARSLLNQLIAGNPNVGRLESKCKGDADELTICVMP